jgi:RND family efflux transporter MFP subunit
MRRRVSKRSLAAVWAAAGLVGLGGCGRERPRHAPPATITAARRVATVEVACTGEGATRTLPATVHARQRAALAARIAAAVVELPLREGEAVAAGAVLVRLDDAALRSALVAAEAGAQAAETERARMESLLQRGAATPREREEATARAAAAQASLSAAKDNLAYAVLRAPFDGRVAARPARVGDVVAPGVPLIEIEGEGGFELRASVEPELAASARPGLRLEARVDGQPAALLATLRAISPAGDPATHRFDVKADLPATSGLRSGLFARIDWPAGAEEPRLSVPASALFRRGGLTGAFVADSGRARLRWVAAGATRAGRTEIRAGLEAGERVIADPAGLADGVPVVEVH